MRQAITPVREEKISKGQPPYEPFGSAPAWWIVFLREMTDLWVGGKALYLILVFSVLLGIEVFMLATDRELSIYTPRQIVFETLKSVIEASLLIGLMIGADSISGERERATLEGLLLTPASRRQILLGKFLAAISAWPVTVALTLPFIRILSQESGVFGAAVLSGLGVGGLLVAGFTALGMLVGIWCNSNRTSFFISLGIFLLVILIGELIATVTGVWEGWLLLINPLSAGFEFLSNFLMRDASSAQSWTFLESPCLFALVVFGLLFFREGLRIGVEAGSSTKKNSLWSQMARGVGVMILVFFVCSTSATPGRALPQTDLTEGDLQVAISMDSKESRTGDTITFETLVTNVGPKKVSALMAALNIINLSQGGDIVDPEDWSPERNQFVQALGPGKSITLSWEVNAILDGDYMVYVVAVPEPENTRTSTQAVASRGLHLSIARYTELNPGGILPYSIGVPTVVLLAILLIFRFRTSQVDTGEVSPEDR